MAKWNIATPAPMVRWLQSKLATTGVFEEGFGDGDGIGRKVSGDGLLSGRASTTGLSADSLNEG